MSTINGKTKEIFKTFSKNLGGGGFGRSTSFAEPNTSAEGEKKLRPNRSFVRTLARSMVVERRVFSSVLCKNLARKYEKKKENIKVVFMSFSQENSPSLVKKRHFGGSWLLHKTPIKRNFLLHDINK